MLSLCRWQQANIDRMGMSHLMRDVEMPLSGVLYRMEDIGFTVDTAFLRQLGERYTQQLHHQQNREAIAKIPMLRFMMEAEHPQCSSEAAEQHHRQKQRPFRNPPRPAFGAPLINPHERKREGIDRQQVHPNQIQQPILHNYNLPRGSASGLRKGVPPLTLSRDWVGDFSILLPRVAQGFRLRRRDSPA